MKRENKNIEIASNIRSAILNASEFLFKEKGFVETSISDISEKASYSRRTIYSYFDSKDVILLHIILNYQNMLIEKVRSILKSNDNFITKYGALCDALIKYHKNTNYSNDNALKEDNEYTKKISDNNLELNILFSEFIKSGIDTKFVIKNIDTTITSYIMWSNINSLIKVSINDEAYITNEFNMNINAFLMKGFIGILNQVLINRIF